MPIRPPKALAPKDALPEDPLTASLEHEVLAEKAATYARLVRKLEEALARYRQEETEQALRSAGQALWYVMIQRDLCGFRRHDLFYKELNVPPAVRLRMGSCITAGRAKVPRDSICAFQEGIPWLL